MDIKYPNTEDIEDKIGKSVCKVCGIEFEYDKKASKGIYCSKRCRYEDHSYIIRNSYTKELKEKKSELAKKQWKTNQRNIEIKEKAIKNKELEIQQKEIEKLKKIEQRERERRRKCLYCGKEYIMSISNKNEKFCNWNCYIKYSKENSKNYNIKAFTLLPNICYYCNEDDKNKLEVHHIDNNPYNNDVNNLRIVCEKCHNKIHKQLAIDSRKSRVKEGLLLRGFRNIINGLRLNMNDENLKDTPYRMLKSYQEICEGLWNKEEIKDILNTTFPSNIDEMIILKDIKTYSLCPHHFLPVIYEISIGYIPDGTVLGASKLPRLIELLAKRPLLQEDLTTEIVEHLYKDINSLGAMVKVKGQHLCMMMRGIKQQNVIMVTSAVRGVFDKDIKTRNEFMELIK